MSYIHIQITNLQKSRQHRGNLIKTQHAATSDRPVFDSSKISVIVIKEWGITADRVLHNGQSDVWVYDGGYTLTLYDEQLVEKKTLSLNSNLFDMVLTAFQDIIATDEYNKRLIKISTSGDAYVSKLCSTAPLKPCGICINNRGHIVIGMHTGWGIHPIKLSIYSSNGSTVLQEIENDEDGKPLFRKEIMQVKQNGEGDYVVADWDRIVCVSSKGRFKWDYSVGESLVYEMVCDKYDNVIIAEYFNSEIHLLSNEGRLMTTLLTEEDGIRQPRSLSIDRHGQLWIGQYESIKVVRYLK